MPVSSYLWRSFFAVLALLSLEVRASGAGPAEWPAENKFIVSRAEYPGLPSPNPRGWYHSVANVVNTPEGLVAVYRLSDSHTAVFTHIMVAYSKDGRTWEGHRSISHRNVWEHQRVWVAPQLSRLKDGRLVIVADLAHRTSGRDWPMLANWQKPDRGMWNYLFWSSDNGRTWSEPQKVDDVGGEPGYIQEFSNGTLAFVRTESFQSPVLVDGPKPWGDIYYRAVAVFSDDGGKTWPRTAIVTDAPFHGDCEVALLELEPGHIVGFTRIGFGGGQFGQPSRIVHSYDYGRTWGQPQLAPFYGQRLHVGKLANSGKLLATYRNRWGTLASYACVFDLSKDINYEPSIQIWEEERATLSDGTLTLRTAPGAQHAVTYGLYPAVDTDSRVELAVEARLERARGPDAGVVLSPGVPLLLTPAGLQLPPAASEDEVDATGTSLATVQVDRSRPEIAVDAGQWHRYRFLRERGRLEISIDGKVVRRLSTAGLEVRPVRFGAQGEAVVHLRQVVAQINNPKDYTVGWSWNARSGKHPDQFRRDHVVVLDRTADSGYSEWTQRPDGTVVVLDYTNDNFRGASHPEAPQTMIKSYVLPEAELLRLLPSQR